VNEPSRVPRSIPRLSFAGHSRGDRARRGPERPAPKPDMRSGCGVSDLGLVQGRAGSSIRHAAPPLEFSPLSSAHRTTALAVVEPVPRSILRARAARSRIDDRERVADAIASRLTSSHSVVSRRRPVRSVPPASGRLPDGEGTIAADLPVRSGSIPAPPDEGGQASVPSRPGWIAAREEGVLAA
jgi:hypothetical protein